MPTLTGRVVIKESGHGFRTRIAFSCPGQSTAIEQCDTDLDGRFELPDWPYLQQGNIIRIEVFSVPPQPPAAKIHSREIVIDDPRNPLLLEIPSDEFVRANVEVVLKFHAASLTFSAGSEIDVTPQGLSIIVGPNGCGKTQALTEIVELCIRQPSQRRVVREVKTSPHIIDQSALRNWLRSAYPMRTTERGDTVEFCDSIIDVSSVMPSEVFRLLTFKLSVEQRFILSRFQQFAPVGAAPMNLIDHIHRNDAMLEALTRETREAFQQEIFPNFGPTLGFRVAGLGTIVPGDRASGAHRRALQSFPMLDESGDGLRSFVCTLIALIACPHPILCIDEPEAFLHPPQARILGRKLAEAGLTRQIFVATHSADVILGALSIPTAQVQIIRVRRIGACNLAVSLPPNVLSDISRDPQWESTELLASMFYVGAVLCEADSDRRFYRWLASNRELSFVSCNGKGGIAKAASVLRCLGIPVVTITDFDVLSNEVELISIIKAVGADPDSIIDKNVRYSEIRNALHVGKERDLSEIKRELFAALQDTDDIDRGKFLARISPIVASAKKGYEVKKHGINTLKGELHSACNTLLDRLAAIGVFVVPFGELEGWWRSGPAGKNEWISAAWDRARADSSAFEDARRFVARACEHLSAVASRSQT